ncbi:MAG: hypothetical protein JWO48_1019 [Bryobacterales bacterium]|nr:hypothetical protein [Bryobacterales bacterium]
MLSPLCALACCVLSSAQSELPKHVLQLAQLKRDVQAALKTLPNYSCVETIERSMRKNAQQPFRHVDIVHVEVAVTGDRELYSWPGANKFEERDITDMINSGTVSNGDFATALRSVLVNNVSIITWHSYEEQIGRFNELYAAKRQTIRWDYRIPYNLSGWTLRYGGRRGRVSEAGSFWADAQSLDVLRLEANADEIPPDLPLTAVKSTLEYTRVRFGSQDLLIPQSAELIVTELNGQQRRNVIEFSHCREFTARTSVSFNAAENITENPAIPVVEISLPAGLRLSVRLAHAVDSETAAVGDPISASVEADVKQKGKLLVPQGAILRGRIRQLDSHAIPREYHVIGLEFTDLEFPGHHGRFFGEMEYIGLPAALMDATTGVRTKIDESILSHLQIATRVQRETYWTREIPGVSTFSIKGRRLMLPEGLHMTWRTVNLAK